MSRISGFIAANVIDGKAVSLSARQPHIHMKLLGSTMPASVQADSGQLDQVTFYPKSGKEGIVAVVVTVVTRGRSEHGDWDYIPVFLKIVWKKADEGDKLYPFVDLDSPWIPADRIGQVTINAIEVMLRSGLRFTTYKRFVMKGYEDDKKHPEHVPDGDLLCRYLWGTAHAADVLHAVVQEKLEPTRQKQIEALTTQVGVLDKKLLRAGMLYAERLSDLERERNSAIVTCNGAERMYFEERALRRKDIPVSKLLSWIPTFLRPKSVREFIVAMGPLASADEVTSR